MIKLAVFVLLVSLAVGAGTGQARPGASSPTASQLSLCIATGAPWRRGTARGNKYVITRRNVTCAFAKTWVARLSGRRVTRPAQSIPGPARLDLHRHRPVRRQGRDRRVRARRRHRLRLGPEVLLARRYAAAGSATPALVKTSSPSPASTRTVSPSANSPSSSRSASGFSTSRWIARFSGRAP